MDWLLLYYWPATLSASGIPMPVWSSIGVPLPGPSARYADPGPLDVELVSVLYEVLVERADCGVCWAPLGPGVTVELPLRWSKETVSFGSAGLRRATGSSSPAIERH